MGSTHGGTGRTGLSVVSVFVLPAAQARRRMGRGSGRMGCFARFTAWVGRGGHGRGPGLLNPGFLFLSHPRAKQSLHRLP